MSLGAPRLHLRRTDSTNDRARALALAGAPHGTLVTAAHQAAGRGRQGRGWIAPAGRALMASLVLRAPPPLLPLAAAVAVAEALGPAARIKWPNDVLLDGRKVAGLLAEGRPREGWAVLGVGVNVAVRDADLPAGLRGKAGTLGREPEDVERVLADVVCALEAWLSATPDAIVAAWCARDALAGRTVRWPGGTGTARGIDAEGRLLVETAAGARHALVAGEVHLGGVAGP